MSDEMLLISTATEAVDVFSKLFDGTSVRCGSNTSALRRMGTEGSSVIIDCSKTNKRIGLLTLDEFPDEFAIVVCDKDTPDDAVSQKMPISMLQTTLVVRYMEEHFAKQ